MSITLIVFLPLLAAIIAGLGNRIIGNVPAKLVTTAALFVACGLSWPIFLGFLSGSSRIGLLRPSPVRWTTTWESERASRTSRARTSLAPSTASRRTERGSSSP